MELHDILMVVVLVVGVYREMICRRKDSFSRLQPKELLRSLFSPDFVEKSRKDCRHEGSENEFVAEKDKTEQFQANDKEQNIMKDHLGLFGDRLLRVLHVVGASPETIVSVIEKVIVNISMLKVGMYIVAQSDYSFVMGNVSFITSVNQAIPS